MRRTASMLLRISSNSAARAWRRRWEAPYWSRVIWSWRWLSSYMVWSSCGIKQETRADVSLSLSRHPWFDWFLRSAGAIASWCSSGARCCFCWTRPASSPARWWSPGASCGCGSPPSSVWFRPPPGGCWVGRFPWTSASFINDAKRRQQQQQNPEEPIRRAQSRRHIKSDLLGGFQLLLLLGQTTLHVVAVLIHLGGHALGALLLRLASLHPASTNNYNELNYNS